MRKKATANGVGRHNLFGPPLVLEGEDAAAYDELMGRVYAAIKPVDVIDEMLIADAVSSEWEFLRWSRVKSNLLRACAVKALEAFLKKISITLFTGNILRPIFRRSFRKIFRKIRPMVMPRPWRTIVPGTNRMLSTR